MGKIGLEKKLLIILIAGEKPKVVPVKTLNCGTEIIKAEVNGERRYVKIDALRRKYDETYGDKKFKLLGYQKTNEGFKLEKY